MQLRLYRRRVLGYFCRNKVTRSSDLPGDKIYKDGDKKIAPLFNKAFSFPDNICIKDLAGQYTYLQLHDNSKKLSRQISNICGSGSSSTVAFFCSNDVLAIVILWASWMSGQKVLLMNRNQPPNELTDLIQKTKTKIIISSDSYEKCSKKLAFENSIPLMFVDHKFLNICKTQCNLKPQLLNATQSKIPEGFFLNEFYNDSEAVFLRNKKNPSETILQTHKELGAEIENIVKLWNLSKNDLILYMCPSFEYCNDEYIFNVLLPLSVGGQAYLLEPFDSKIAWRTILGINIPPKERLNILIAEPNVYHQLIQEYDKMFAGDKRMVDYIKDYCLNNIRLMISCFDRPDPICSSTWLAITGHNLKSSAYSIEHLVLKEVNNVLDKAALSHLLMDAKIKVRIFDAQNKVILELNGGQNERYLNSSKVVIGRIAISNHNESFHATGEIASFSNGILKVIGRYLYNPK